MCADLKDQFVMSSKYFMANYIVVLFAMKDFISQSVGFKTNFCFTLQIVSKRSFFFFFPNI